MGEAPRSGEVSTVNNDRVFAMSFAGVYPHYVAKAENKGRTMGEVDEIVRWLTGYTKTGSQYRERWRLGSFMVRVRRLRRLPKPRRYRSGF